MSQQTLSAHTHPKSKQGLIYAAFCYILWGLFPLYWHLLADVPSLVILANRMVWSTVFLMIFCLLVNRKSLLEVIRVRKNILYMGLAGVVISINWGTYIYAVNNDHIVESSLGYYINPLVSVLLAVLFLKEKLNRLETLAALSAFVGVAYFTINYGSFPVIAFALALSHGFYGLIKKKANLPTLSGLTLETLLMTPIALIYLIYAMKNNTFVVSELPFLSSFLLVMGGIVTAIPLLLFANAVKLLPYSKIAFIQYIGPTLQLLTGIFVFHEKFTPAHAVCFGFIWLGLIIFTFSLIRKSGKKFK